MNTPCFYHTELKRQNTDVRGTLGNGHLRNLTQGRHPRQGRKFSITALTFAGSFSPFCIWLALLFYCWS